MWFSTERKGKKASFERGTEKLEKSASIQILFIALTSPCTSLPNAERFLFAFMIRTSNNFIPRLTFNGLASIYSSKALEFAFFLAYKVFANYVNRCGCVCAGIINGQSWSIELFLRLTENVNSFSAWKNMGILAELSCG